MSGNHLTNLQELRDKLPPLDESLYKLNEEEVSFYKQQTGIHDDEELKRHIIAVQTEAYAVFPFPCITTFRFTQLKISHLPAYSQLLELGKRRPGAIFLDIGCCFGNDAFKAIADGYPLDNVVASDLYQGFWDAGLKLFKRTPETYPVPFVAGDVFDHANLEPVPVFTAASPPTTSRPALMGLTSLNSLRGHLSAIHASAFFHLFQEDRQLELARALACLLSPEPGSMIFGMHSALHEKGFRETPIADRKMFCHSPDSWRELWDGVVFEKSTVKVDAKIVPATSKDLEGLFPNMNFWWLHWSITRL